MSFIVYDLENIYRQTFGGKPYRVSESNQDSSQLSDLTTQYQGKEIWLPIRFVELDKEVFGTDSILIPYAVIKLDGKKSFAKTSLPERTGTVKEQYNIEDWSIDINGFLIDERQRIWPDEEIKVLKKLYDTASAFRLENALSNILLGDITRVVIESLTFPEVVGGRRHIRPFSMKLESDSIFELEI
jgi:hypothetical protein